MTTPVDFDRALSETEDFFFRQLGSRSAREAQKRKVKRGISEVLRRMRRSALVLAVLLTALIVYSIAVAPIGFFTWLLALPTIFLVAILTLFWPSRRREPRERAETPARLEAAAAQTEDWLLHRCSELPRQTLPAVDTILVTLSELQPSLAELPRGTQLEGETRRLICQHLPRLVDSYLDLPPAEREPRSESTMRLRESLEIVADELSRLSEEIGQDRRHGFETQSRFIETRYRDGG